jgi:hypothetical protein
MPLKRTYHVNMGTPAKNAAKLRKLEKTVYRRNLGEIKYVVGHLSSTQIVNGGFRTDIQTGLACGPNQGQRVGNEIRVKEIYISGDSGSALVDVYILQSRSGEAPTLANFSPTIAGHLTQGTAQDHFRILRHYKHIGGSSPTFYMRYRFSIPMKVTYTGPTAGEVSRNQIYVVFINRSGGNQNVQFSSTLKYID